MDEKGSEVEELERMLANESAEAIQISYSVIRSITKDFCQVIGHGGFGIVYLGTLRNDVMVAVKELRLSLDFSDTQFLGEIKCLKRVKHSNIVRFLGYCAYTDGVVMKVEGEDRLVDVPKRFLCFEYAPNGNLQDYLQEKTCGREWSVHYKIFRGICHGLNYLHCQRITHLDLKPENVLLGVQMEPMITDFGLSRCNDGTQSTIFTKHLQGTPGYIPPELIDEGKISFKSDIYNLGIILIRLFTGSNKDIPENWCESINVDCQQMETCIEIAQLCSSRDPNKRPTIYEIICKLTETEIMIKSISPVSIIEPRNDPNSKLCQNVKRFLAQRAETGEYRRSSEKLPMERPKWKLAFLSPPKLPIITGKKIEDANNNPLMVILMDADTGKPSALPKALEIELVPLLGNFPRNCWDADDFQRGIVKDLEGKHPLLAGEYRLTMWDGRATVNKLMFTDHSRKCCCMLRIGVRVVPFSYRGARILEAMTEAFMVRGPHGRERNYKWQLAFQSQLRVPVYSGTMIRDVIGNLLEIILVDAETGSPSAPSTELDIQLVPLDGGFHMVNDDKDWSAHHLRWHIMDRYKEQEAPILCGDVSLTMKDGGSVTVNELQSMTPGYGICIGACVKAGGNNGPGRIREGVTREFIVQDINRYMDEKHYPPALADDICRLEMISWGGDFHMRLTQNNVKNVQDFLRMLAVKPNKLRAMMGHGMEDIQWKKITSHARRCVLPDDKVYAYSTAQATIYLTPIFDLLKVEFGGVACPLYQLDDAQKILVQQTMQEAYEHCDSLQEVQQTWKLAFKNQPRLPIHTGSRIMDATGNPLEIILMDAKTGSPLDFPVDLHIRLEPLLGDFPPYDGEEDWHAEEFQRAIVKKRRQKDEPLLKCDYGEDFRIHWHIMSHGRVTVDLVQFTDDSSWVRCRKFRIGACVLPDEKYNAFRIVEAMTEAFVVEDLNRKHYPPVLGDPVWRLEMIDKEGPCHRNLTSNNVDTVQELCRMLTVEHDKLRTIVGDSMTDRMWDMMTSHARGCAVGDKVYMYNGANCTIYFDSVFHRLFNVQIDGDTYSLQYMNDAQRMFVRQLIQEAYEHRHNLQEIDAAMELRKHATDHTSHLIDGNVSGFPYSSPFDDDDSYY